MRSEDPVSKRLDRAWFSGGDTDRVFNLLAVVSSGLPVAVGLLVDGRVIRGVLSDPDALTDAATTALQRPLDTFAVEWEDDVRTTFGETFKRHAEQRKTQAAEDREVVNRYFEAPTPPSVDAIADTDLAPFYRELTEPSTVVMRQVQLVLDESTADIDVLSVRRSAISAWWFLDSEDGARVNYGPPAN
ncbi:hypothetical protein [Modestobacter lapidis]|nr:hypothetical protein [Modestobacter lapidis]